MTPDPARAREEFTRFERARIIGARALQVSSGAPILIEVDAEAAIDPIGVAEREFTEGVIPITVLRLHKASASA